MPIPRPRMGKDPEKEGAFIARCMGTVLMKREYPKNVQRLAVCYSSWREAKKMKERHNMEDKMNDLRKKISKIRLEHRTLARQLEKIKQYRKNNSVVTERFSSLRTAIETAIKAGFGKEYWISDFSNKEIIFRKEGGEIASTGEETYQKVGYKVTKGAVELVGAPEAVAKVVNYEMSTKDKATLVVMDSKIKSKL